VASADDRRIEQQERTLLQYAEENGYGSCACFRDNGESGLSLDRPGLQSLISEIQDGKIKTVIAADMCRIARGSLPMGEWIEIIKKHGIEFISVSDGFRFPDDDKWFGVLTFLANLATHKT